MTKTATVYLLDPQAATIQAVEIRALTGYTEAYKLIGCQLVSVVPFDGHHTLIVDEDGLQDGLSGFTIFDGYPQPIAGKIVLAGDRAEGMFSQPQISIEEAAKRFQCCKPVLDPVFAEQDENTPKGVILSGALMGFQTRIERTTPAVVAGGVQ